MNCKSCGSYYPNDEKSCPYCGYVMSKAEKKVDARKTRAAAREVPKDEQKRAEVAIKAFWDEPKTPMETKLLYTTDERAKSTLGTAARALIGAAVAGTFGAAVGIASGREKSVSKSATFAVTYMNGRKGKETVDVRSKRFDELCKYLID